MFKSFLICLVFLATTPAFSQQAQRYSHNLDWAMFSDDGACWATTMHTVNDVQYFLFVTVFEGKGAPQVSINGHPKFPTKKGLNLRVNGKRYPMGSDGLSAWASEKIDTFLIDHLTIADKQKTKGITLEIPKHPNIEFSPIGFREAYIEILSRCHLSTNLNMS